ncbi:M48 family metalloprotease [Bauldia sp.]|uniref:M48 family metalloprotease n=1 Tax=Bauldia sp. TaxID=2575872 RepID=UPI003BAD234E
MTASATHDRNGSGIGRLRALAGLLVAAVVLAGCTTLMTAGTTGPNASIIGGDLNAGPEEHARIVAAYGGIYRDDALERTVARIVGRVVAASDEPDQPYRITILNAPAINAFALPGGYLYVTRGLLTLANDSAEVAAVLAHEMAHVTANHAVERQNKARNAVIVSRVVTDVLDDDTGGRLALASSQRSLASFSRQQELEADAMGVKTIGRAGYDPFAAARFLTTMARFAAHKVSTGPTMEKAPDFLASHPSTPERVEFATRAARAFGAPGIGDTDRERYLDGLDGAIFGDDPSQGYVRDRTFIHPSLRVGFSVPDGFVIDNTSDAVLATGADGTALRFDAVALVRGADLGQYLASGWVNGLDTGSIRRFTVNGMPAASANASAKGWAFRIAIIQADSGATYRFIFANEAATQGLDEAATLTVSSFRQLDQRELARLKPLRIKVFTARAGDTQASLAQRMRGVDRPQALLQALNNLKPGAPIAPGSKVKIVTDR